MTKSHKLIKKLQTCERKVTKSHKLVKIGNELVKEKVTQSHTLVKKCHKKWQTSEKSHKLMEKKWQKVTY